VVGPDRSGGGPCPGGESPWAGAAARGVASAAELLPRCRLAVVGGETKSLFR
jgi:hypothetical protein